MRNTSIEDLPARIQRQIELDTERDKIYEDNRISVTDCLGCLRKAWYRRKQPKPLTMQQRWWFYRGNVFDGLWTPLFPRNQVALTHRIRDPKYPPIVISGRLDFIDDDGAVADLKTTDNLYWISKEGAKEDNRKQVMFYCWCQAKTHGRLYYISLKDALKVEVDFTEDEALALVEEMEASAKELYTALVLNEPPKRDAKHTASYWECGVSKDGVSYCEYREDCKLQ